MSRIGNLHIDIPAGVTVTVAGDQVTVKGPKGELSQELTGGITLEQADGKLTVVRPSDDKEHRSLHGLYRALIHNMVVGVSTGYKKEMVKSFYNPYKFYQLYNLAACKNKTVMLNDDFMIFLKNITQGYYPQ